MLVQPFAKKQSDSAQEIGKVGFVPSASGAIGHQFAPISSSWHLTLTLKSALPFFLSFLAFSQPSLSSPHAYLSVFFLMILKRMKKKMCLQGNFCASQPWQIFFFLNANQKALPYSPFIMFAREMYNVMIILHTITTSTSSGVFCQKYAELWISLLSSTQLWF